MPLPLKKITDCGAKPCPFTARTNPGEPAGMLGGVSEVTVGEGLFATPSPHDASSSAATNTNRFWSELFLFKSPAPSESQRSLRPGHFEPARPRVGPIEVATGIGETTRNEGFGQSGCLGFRRRATKPAFPYPLALLLRLKAQSRAVGCCGVRRRSDGNH